MTIPWSPRVENWVPYPSEDLSCEQCASRSTHLVKVKLDRRTKRDILICENCGHHTDRWNRREPE